MSKTNIQKKLDDDTVDIDTLAAEVVEDSNVTLSKELDSVVPSEVQKEVDTALEEVPPAEIVLEPVEPVLDHHISLDSEDDLAADTDFSLDSIDLDPPQSDDDLGTIFPDVDSDE